MSITNVPELFGSMVFNDAVMKERLPKDVYKKLKKTMREGTAIDADVAAVVATAMKDWAISKGATHYTHWFQPMTGARGGTVISARGIAENEVKRFFGIEIQAEKEIVFLVVRSDEKQQVMTALMQAVGMKTRSHGIVLSMPLSAAIGLAD